MQTSFETVELPLDVTFEIARGETTTTENVVVTIAAGGETGYGAAAPSGRYGETTETVTALLPEFLSVVESVGDPHARRKIHRRMLSVADGNPSTRAAVDIALWDLAGKLLGEPLYRLLGLDADGTPPTSITVGIDETEAMKRRTREAAEAGYPIVKLKLGTDRDRQILEAVRAAAPGVRLRVDANEAWTPTEAIRKSRWLAEYDVEFLEQPVEAGGGLKRVHERSPIPVAADESIRAVEDVPAVAERCSIANLKLMKCGGITPTLEIIHAARAHGLEIMCGCMLETNVSIAAAVHLLSLFEYADLDGSLLLASDPYDGVGVSAGQFDLAGVEVGTGAGPQ